jgi:hypothetical protein
MPKPTLEAQFDAIIKPLEKYEQEFPTVIELLKIIRSEVTEDEFDSYKRLMIEAVYKRLEVKIDFLNRSIEESEITSSTYNDQTKINKSLESYLKMLENRHVYDRFRIFTSRVNQAKLISTDQNQMEEILNIFDNSFTLRDLRARFIGQNGELNVNDNGYNTIQYYKQLRKITMHINAIPYED